MDVFILKLVIYVQMIIYVGFDSLGNGNARVYMYYHYKGDLVHTDFIGRNRIWDGPVFSWT
jgi:hypothetical protein